MTRISRTQGFSTRWLAYLVWVGMDSGYEAWVHVYWRIGRWRVRYRHPVVRG